MSYKTIFGEEFENEFDEKMTHKYGDKYKCVKSVYPDVCKLPESEIQPMTYIARYQGDTVDEAKDLVRKYIKEKEPMWMETYWDTDNTNSYNTVLKSFNNQGTEDKRNFIKDVRQGMEAFNDMAQEYFNMKKHNYVGLDDYHHCKANYNATKRGTQGEAVAKTWGFRKELFDKLKNKYYKNLEDNVVENDFIHDLSVNATGRARAKFGNYDSAEDACADYRAKNPNFPKEYW